jgi:hypothetical protein
MKAWEYRRYGSPDVLAYEEIEAKFLAQRTL